MSLEKIVENTQKVLNILKYLRESSDLELAQDPTTKADILHQFAEHPDRNVQKAVADNPNTSFPTLMKLLRSKHKIDNNPALDLHFLEKPEVSYTDAMYGAMSDNPKLHRYLYDTFHPESKRERQRVVNTLASNTKNSSILHDSLLSNELTPDLLHSVAQSAHLAPQSFKILKATHPYQVAANIRAPEDILNDLVDQAANEKDEYLVNTIATNYAATLSVMHNILEKHPKNFEAHYNLSTHRNADENVLKKLAQSYHTRTRENAVQRLAGSKK